MRSITPQVTPELARWNRGRPPAKARPFRIAAYRKLLEHVARLAYLNKDHLLFFRGQSHDYRNKARASTLYPAIYRGDRVSRSELELRFEVLSKASRSLCLALEKARTEGFREVRRRRYIQWSILQHYEVCPTPLLDLTHSLRVACSFAYLGAEPEKAYVFVLGLPYLMNRVSINSEHDIVNIRLLSICPPDALRPYYQDGYVAGTDEVTVDFDSKDELDFNNRLIAKFELPAPKQFWAPHFGAVPRSYLYPGTDKIDDLCRALRQEIGTRLEPGRLGAFLDEWTRLESRILTAARRRSKKVLSVSEAAGKLSGAKLLPASFIEDLESLRRFRAQAVRQPAAVSTSRVADGRRAVQRLLNTLESHGL